MLYRNPYVLAMSLIRCDREPINRALPNVLLCRHLVANCCLPAVLSSSLAASRGRSLLRPYGLDTQRPYDGRTGVA